MPVTNVIVNGSFTQGSTGWSGTDLETNYTENSYFSNGSTNNLAEMDGTSSQITVMQQTVAISHAGTFGFSFRSALRSGLANNTGEGFRVDILNSAGQVIFTQTVLPTSSAWNTSNYMVNFPAAGNYTVRFTERGPNNSLGAVLDDVSLLVCFVAGTMIDTADGPRAVETLQPGDLVWTQDYGLQPLRWIGQRLVTAAEQRADDRLCPIVFAPGSLGKGLPLRQLMVSPLHRMLVSDWRGELYFGEDQVLVPAKALVNGGTVRQAAPDTDVTYVHFLLDDHQIVLAEGAATESFYPSACSLRGVEAEARAELLRLFPELSVNPLPLVRPALRGYEARLMASG